MSADDRAVAAQSVASSASASSGPGDSDDGLIAAALARRDAHTALTLLMDRYGAMVYRYCRRILGTDADGDDVSQVTFLQAFEAIQRGSRVLNVRGWLLGIARHRCLDRLERRRRGPVLVETEELERVLDDDVRAEIEPLDERARQNLDECLDELDSRSRVVVLFRFQDQLSYDAISKLTGDRPGALRVRVARALPALRGCLERKASRP